MPRTWPGHPRRHTHPSGWPADSRPCARPASCLMFLPYSSTARCCRKCRFSITMALSSSWEEADCQGTSSSHPGYSPAPAGARDVGGPGSWDTPGAPRVASSCYSQCLAMPASYLLLDTLNSFFFFLFFQHPQLSDVHPPRPWSNLSPNENFLYHPSF